MPAVDDVQRIYRHRFPESDRPAKARIWRVLVESFFQRFIGPSDTVLDLGCGYGEFLNHVRCGRRIGVDLNPDSAAALNEGIEFHLGGIGSLEFLADNSVDVGFTSNVLEHLPSKTDVERAMREARRVLKTGGRLIAMGPNLRFLPGKYWDFWDHHVPLTDRSMVELLENLDLAVIRCHPKFLPYTTRSAMPQWPGLVRWYLRLPPLWHIFGRQFLIVAEKPPRSA